MSIDFAEHCRGATPADCGLREGMQAFYYDHVVEILTPCWTPYHAAAFNIEFPKNVPPTRQEWTYTNPTWYKLKAPE